MSIKARLKRLEKKVAAAEVPGAEIGVFAGQPLYTTEERDGVVYCLPLHTTEEFAAMAFRQQSELMTRLTEYDAAADAEENEAPKLPGAGDAQAPLKDGQKRANYIYTTDEKGRVVEIEVATGIRRLVK